LNKRKKSTIQFFYNGKFASEIYGKRSVYLNLDPAHYHQKILAIIKEESKDRRIKILDVGCATGYLGFAAKMGKNYVCGIEISVTAAEEAKKVLDEVVVGNVEEITLPWPRDYFDIIVCSDILEHLFDPKSTLIKLREYLKPEGKLLVVVPNVAYYAVRLMLLRGKWEYQSHGILDYGHIRWFTKETARKLLMESGFPIVDVIPWIILPLPLRILDRKLCMFLSKIFGKFLDTWFARSFLFIAVKK